MKQITSSRSWTVLNVSETTDIDLSYGYGWIDDVGNVPGEEWRGHSAGGTITRRF